MPRWDFICPVCKSVSDLTFPSHAAAQYPVWCSECPASLMERLTPAPSFRITGYSAHNGYTTPTDK